MVLNECIQEYLTFIRQIRCLSENTVQGYSEDLKHLSNILGLNKDINSISIIELRNTIGELSREKYSTLSINRYIASARGFFAYCKKQKIIEYNPALELKNLKTPKYLPVYMTQKELDDICNIPEKINILWPARDKAIFEMFYSSGCRVSELASLTFKNFNRDFTSAVITGKGKKMREVYFEKDSVIALKKYLLDRKTRFPESFKGGNAYVPNIFLNYRGESLSSRGIQYIVSRYSGPEGTNKKITPHSFRHTFATLMLNNGADVRMIQKMLGHSSINTTQKYTHLNKRKLKAIYDQAFPHSGKKD